MARADQPSRARRPRRAVRSVGAGTAAPTRRTDRRAAGRLDGSTALERALAEAGGTVTALLEHLVGEPIEADVGCHAQLAAAPSNVLRVAEGQPVVARWALLTGRRTTCPYVYAESLIDPGRLSERAGRRLATSRDPIGRILGEEGMATTRQPMGGPLGLVWPAPAARAPAVRDHLVARTYRLDSGGGPVMVVSEWFLPSLQPFLAGR